LRLAPPGTSSFGSVKNETGWIFPAIPSGTPRNLIEISKIDAAVRGQIAVMDLSRHQIGTVWLGAYGRGSGDKLIGSNLKTVAGIPYGIPEQTANPSLFMKLAKLIVRPDTRKPFQELFWDVENGRPYTEESAKDLRPFLQAIRSGPSAINRQPWRFAVAGSLVHVYKASKSAVSALDIGIAIGNIQVLTIENNHLPGFSVVSPAPQAYLGGTYVCSVSFRD
jgi:hypothetical protein